MSWKKNKAKHQARAKSYYESNQEKLVKKTKQWREENSEKAQKYMKMYYEENKEYFFKKGRDWREDNQEKIGQQQVQFYKNNLGKQWQYTKRRLENNLQARLANNIRARLRNALKKRDQQKPCSAILELGCTQQELVIYVEKQLSSNMNWNNYGVGIGKWNLDHSIPLASFNLEDIEQFKKASHYSNLKPMWSVDNSRKGAKLEGSNV